MPRGGQILRPGGEKSLRWGGEETSRAQAKIILPPLTNFSSTPLHSILISCVKSKIKYNHFQSNQISLLNLCITRSTADNSNMYTFD